MDFFTREAGQRRRAWLDDKLEAGGETLDYYLGPTGAPDKLRAIAKALTFTDAGDMQAAADASRDLWNNPSIGSAANYAAAGTALALPMYSARLGQGIADTATEMVRAYDPSVARSTAWNVEDMYHGTPDARGVRDAGGFGPRNQSVSHIADPDEWEALGRALREVEPQSPEYFEILDKRGALRKTREINQPVFLSPDRRIAESYADDARAFDYQNADPAVLATRTNPQRVLDVNAGGKNFRGISQERVKKALVESGVSESDVDRAMAGLAGAAGRTDGNISTDDLAFLANDFGFEAVDVSNVVDTYNATGRPGRVRMMMDPTAVEIPALQSNTDQITETPAQEVARLLREGRGDEVTDEMLGSFTANDNMELARLYEQGATGADMPMDEASRMARAREMGFDADTTTYHGTDIDFAAANTDMGQGERYKTGFYSSSNPNVAESYTTSESGRILPLVTRDQFGGPVVDVQGGAWNDIGPDAPTYHQSVGDEDAAFYFGDLFNDLAHEGQGLSTNAVARNARFEGDSNAQFLNVIDRGPGAPFNLESYKPSDVRADFYPHNIRSRFARFDPRLKHLANLSAGIGGVGILTAQQAQQDPNREQAIKVIKKYLANTKAN